MTTVYVPQEHVNHVINEKDVAQARIDQPDGINCGVCGKENDNADDVGWWYKHYNGNYVAHCITCSYEQGLFPHTGER